MRGCNYLSARKTRNESLTFFRNSLSFNYSNSISLFLFKKRNVLGSLYAKIVRMLMIKN